MPPAPAPAPVPSPMPGVVHHPVQRPARTAGQKMAIVAVVALVAGGVLGYVVRGDGG